MPSSNPAMNDKVWAKEIRASRGGGGFSPAYGPDAGQPGYAQPGYGQPGSGTGYAPPTAPVETMRVSGSLTAAGILLLILCVGGVFGWNAVTVTYGPVLLDGERASSVAMPSWLFASWIVGFGLAILTIFKPKFARVTGPLYALAEGLLVGAISHAYEADYKGIVLQAVGLTIGVFITMLVLYATGTIRVTDRLRTGIIAATGGVMLLYLFDLLLRGVFHSSVPMIHEAGGFGIAFSLAVVALAAFNLLLDFDLIERGARAGAPRYMEWYGAFALIVTLVWLYLEILRLLSKLNRR